MRPVEIAGAVAWISAIPLASWPQQRRLADGQMRPAMVTDLEWHGFGRMTDEIVANLMQHYPACRSDLRMLSVVMLGHDIPRHRDEQPPSFVTRVHVPLVSNPLATFNGRHLAPGFAYEIDTREPHEVRNDGATPRIHFMFDVKQ